MSCDKFSIPRMPFSKRYPLAKNSLCIRNICAFTLLELLLVISVIAVLTLLITGSFATPKALALTAQGENLVGHLMFAKMSAHSTNHPVQVRFYRYASSDVSGENTSNPSSGKYRAVQSFELQDTGAYVPIEKPMYFSNRIIIDSGLILSTFFTRPTMTAGSSDIPLPGVLSSYEYTYFYFLPDGSTDLSVNSKSFLTLHDITLGDSLKSIPPNFFTLQINPVNGNVQVYRP